MDVYPRIDQKIILHTLNEIKIIGNVNVTGRTLKAFLTDNTPFIVVYKYKINIPEDQETLILNKDQIRYIETINDTQKPAGGNWKKLTVQVTEKLSMAGEVDITGYDRLSDFIQDQDDTFFKILLSADKKDKYKIIYVSRSNLIWFTTKDN